MSQVLITRSEAVTLVRELTHNDWTERDILDFVDCLAGLGVLKLKEETEETTDFICVSSLTKGDTLKTVYVNHALINHIGDKLREKCRAIFGTSWSNDVARVFARTAITEYELQKAKDNK